MASEGEAGTAATTEPETGEGYVSFMLNICYSYKYAGPDSDHLWKYKPHIRPFLAVKRC